MSNMSYCRFENTYPDLVDCREAMDEELTSDEEIRYRRKLIKLCAAIADEYRHEVEA